MTTATAETAPDEILATLPGVWEEVAPGWFVRQYNDGQLFIEAKINADNPLVRFQAKASGQYPGVINAVQLVAEETAPRLDQAAVSLAIARLESRLGTTAKSIADQHRHGCMPPAMAQLLYDLRQVEYDALSAKETVTVPDLQALERGGRFMVASELFARCDEHARQALLHDEHHSVRSAAFISQQSL